MGQSVDVGSCGNCGRKIVRGTAVCPGCKARIRYAAPLAAELIARKAGFWSRLSGNQKLLIVGTATSLSLCLWSSFSVDPKDVERASNQFKNAHHPEEVIEVGMGRGQVRNLCGEPDYVRSERFPPLFTDDWEYGDWTIHFEQGAVTGLSKH